MSGSSNISDIRCRNCGKIFGWARNVSNLESLELFCCRNCLINHMMVVFEDGDDDEVYPGQ